MWLLARDVETSKAANECSNGTPRCQDVPALLSCVDSSVRHSGHRVAAALVGTKHIYTRRQMASRRGGLGATPSARCQATVLVTKIFTYGVVGRTFVPEESRHEGCEIRV